MPDDASRSPSARDIAPSLLGVGNAVKEYNLRGSTVDLKDLADNRSPKAVLGVGDRGAEALLYFSRLPWVHSWQDLDYYADFRNQVEVMRLSKAGGLIHRAPRGCGPA